MFGFPARVGTVPALQGAPPRMNLGEPALKRPTQMKRPITCGIFARGILAAGGAALLLAGPARSADVTAYSVRKAQLFVQSNEEDAPISTFPPYAAIARVEGDVSAILGAEVRTPGFGLSFPLTENAAGDAFEVSFPAQSIDDLNTLFGSGTYTITVDSENDGFNFSQLDLSGGGFPADIPRVSNFLAAQSIDPEADFTLNWNASSHPFELVIEDDGGFRIYAVSGTGTSAVIPAFTLGADAMFTARLRFLNTTDEDASSIPGATGRAGFYNETSLQIWTGEENGGGGGEDTEPPMLVITNPLDGAANVPVSSVVTFIFSEPMTPSHQIQWSANVNAASVSYSWLGDTTLIATYPGGWPADAEVTWQLDTESFTDVAGNSLAFAAEGSFSTGAGSVDPCDGGPGQDSGQGFALLQKLVHYVQTGNAEPVFDAENEAVFYAMYRGASNQTINAVNISGPALDETLLPTFGFYTFNEVFGSASALDAAYAAGEYTMAASSTEGAFEASLAVGTAAEATIPRILNLEEMRTMDVSSPFILTFNGIPGAGENDSISISFSGGDGSTFFAPDPCGNIELPATATSIEIPAGTFSSGVTYEGSIIYSRMTDMDSTSIPDTFATASLTASTRFTITIGGGVNPEPAPPSWLAPVRNGDGTIFFPLAADAGAVLVIEATSDFETWTVVGTEVAADGNAAVTVPSDESHRYFRAKIELTVE